MQTTATRSVLADIIDTRRSRYPERNTATLERIMYRHGIPTARLNGALYALDRWGYRDDDGNLKQAHQWERIDQWTGDEIMNWLGY